MAFIAGCIGLAVCLAVGWFFIKLILLGIAMLISAITNK
jgi:hypothetical protein